jgi:serine/threonine protein kinase
VYDGITEPASVNVVARVSSRILREERAYHICKNLIKSVDPEGNHIIRPIDIVRLNSQHGDRGPLIVCIFEYPGDNYLRTVIDYGDAYYRGRRVGDKHEAFQKSFATDEVVPLQTFLDFAVGAAECLEVLHHGQRIVHGEIRGDAFHMNIDTGKVKLINFGSGLRTFEHGLTSIGWSTLSKELGAKTKLSYMSPEQTGRMPAEPDSRTDIYSLGILFWTILTQDAPFEGNTPMDIIQGVLGRRLPTVSSVRMDIPDVIGKIIQKMTAKTIGERYHSASGLKHDLIEVRRLLGVGDSAALQHWEIATKDVSSFFILPNIMVGRQAEHDEVAKIIDKVSRRNFVLQNQDVYSISSGSSLSERRLETFNAAIGIVYASSEGDNTSSAEENSISMLSPGSFPGESRHSIPSRSSHLRSTNSSLHNSIDSQDSVNQSNNGNSSVKPWEKSNSHSMDNTSMVDGTVPGGSRTSSDGIGSLISKRNSAKYRRKGRCEVVSIAGAAGLGKSCLVQSVQVEARRRGYFASSKFDLAQKTPFGPVLKLLSSLFKQVFSENNTDTPFHILLKQYVRPGWPMLHRVLGLPDFLLGPMTSVPPNPHRNYPHSSPSNQSQSQSNQSNQSNQSVQSHQSHLSRHSNLSTTHLSQGYNKSILAEIHQHEQSPSSTHSSQHLSMARGSQSSQDFLRAGSSTKSMRLMNTFLDVLRVFTQHKFICFCLDDLQFADDESLDLITQIVASRMKMVIIVTYRPEEILPEKIKGILEPPETEGISLCSRFQRYHAHANILQNM